MVRSQDDRSFQRHPFRVIDPPTEIELVERPEPAPADEIRDVHEAATGSSESRTGFGLRTLDFGPWTLGFGLQPHLPSTFCFLPSSFSRSAIRFLISASIVELVCAEVICELFMTFAPSAIKIGRA